MEQTNPYRAEADRLRTIADKLRQPSAHDEAMRNAFPLGAGFGHGSQRSRDRKIEARISRATKAVHAEAKAKQAEAMADAWDRGEPTEAEKAAKRRELIRASIKAAVKQEAADRKTMPEEQRLFIGDLGGGVMYCDRSIEKNGDYKKLAFLSRSGFAYEPLNWYAKRVPPSMRARIEAHAAGEVERMKERAEADRIARENEKQWRKANDPSHTNPTIS
jgi:hypothetical protein